jgi:hypothetical protein
MIPFIFLVKTYYSSLTEGKMTSYWLMGAAPSFQEMAAKVIDTSTQKINLEDESEQVSTLSKLTDFINLQTFAEREIVMWSDGLELVNPQKEVYSVASANDPFWLVNRLENYFTNSREIIGKEKEKGNSESIGYLAKSLENRPNYISDYSQEELDKILPLTSWDEKQTKAYLGMAKSKGLI